MSNKIRTNDYKEIYFSLSRRRNFSFTYMRVYERERLYSMSNRLFLNLDCLFILVMLLHSVHASKASIVVNVIYTILWQTEDSCFKFTENSPKVWLMLFLVTFLKSIQFGLTIYTWNQSCCSLLFQNLCADNTKKLSSNQAAAVSELQVTCQNDLEHRENAENMTEAATLEKTSVIKGQLSFTIWVINITELTPDLINIWCVLHDFSWNLWISQRRQNVNVYVLPLEMPWANTYKLSAAAWY